jgi:hypothetical protein
MSLLINESMLHRIFKKISAPFLNPRVVKFGAYQNFKNTTIQKNQAEFSEYPLDSGF